MKAKLKKYLVIISLALAAVFALSACSVSVKVTNSSDSSEGESSGVLDGIVSGVLTEDELSGIDEAMQVLPEDGSYNSKDEVALYIHLYGKLPSNYITKKEAENLGWEGGSLESFAPGKSIGGDKFGNYEGLLPEADGRTYKECDIDTEGKSSRGEKRIVFSNDGLIYYTEDHYETFEELYGE